MKRITPLAALFVACSLCWLIGYKKGLQQYADLSRDEVTELPTRVLWNTMKALSQLRAGKIDVGTRTVEKVCFASGAMVYSDPVLRHVKFTQFYTPDVIRYRSTYCTNNSEWTLEEKQLETLLANRK